MSDTETRNKSNDRDSVATFISSFVCMIAFLVMHQINVFSSHFASAFNISETNVGIYFTKMNSIRSFLIMLGIIIEYIIYKSKVEICIYMSSVTFCLMFLMRLSLLIIIYIFRNVALISYIILIAEALFFGAFQNTFFRLTPQYSRTTTLSIQFSGLLVFIIQCICDYYSYSNPISNVKIQYYILILTNAVALGLWIFYLFYFDKYFPLSINKESYKIDENYSLITYRQITEIKEVVLYVSSEIKNKEYELITLMRMNVPSELIQKEKKNYHDIFDNTLVNLYKFETLKHELDELLSKITNLERLKNFVENFIKFELDKFLEEMKKALEEIKKLDISQIKNGVYYMNVVDDHQEKSIQIYSIFHNYLYRSFVKQNNPKKIAELKKEAEILTKAVSSQNKNLYAYNFNQKQYMDTKTTQVIPHADQMYNLLLEIFVELNEKLIDEIKKIINIFEEENELENLIEQIKNIIEIKKDSHGLEKIEELIKELLNMNERYTGYCQDNIFEQNEDKIKNISDILKQEPIKLKATSDELVKKLKSVISLNSNIYKTIKLQMQIKGFNKKKFEDTYIIIEGIYYEEISKIDLKTIEKFNIIKLMKDIEILLDESKEFCYQVTIPEELNEGIKKSYNWKKTIDTIANSEDFIILKPKIKKLNELFERFSSWLLFQRYNISHKDIVLYNDTKAKLLNQSQLVNKNIREIENKIKELQTNNDIINDINKTSSSLQLSIGGLEQTMEAYHYYKAKKIKEQQNINITKENLKSSQKSANEIIKKLKNEIVKIENQKEEIIKSINGLNSNTTVYYNSLINYLLDLIKKRIDLLSKIKLDYISRIENLKDEIASETQEIKGKLIKTGLSYQFIGCLSPFIMGIIASVIKDFAYPSLLPYAFLVKVDCHLINKTAALLFTLGSLTIFLFDKYVVSFREWRSLMNLFWLLLIPQLNILIFSLLGIHTKSVLFRSLVGSKALVLLMTMALLYFYSVMESTSYVAVANYIFHKSKNILETLPILTYLNITTMFFHYVFSKISVGYNATRVQYGLVLPHFNSLVNDRNQTLCVWVTESIKAAFKDFLLDFKMNIRDYI